VRRTQQSAGYVRSRTQRAEVRAAWFVCRNQILQRAERHLPQPRALLRNTQT
jgi:hypothetical protein